MLFTIWTTLLIVLSCYVLKNIIRVVEGNIIWEMTSEGNENYFESAGDSIYRGFVLPRKLQSMYDGNERADDFQVVSYLRCSS